MDVNLENRTKSPSFQFRFDSIEEFSGEKNKLGDEFIDLDLKQEVKTEIDDFYIGEYTPEAIQVNGQKRKNTEEPNPETLKKIKQEISVFEESSDVIILNTPNETKRHVQLEKHVCTFQSP